jgi:hypothetical protein
VRVSLLRSSTISGHRISSCARPRCASCSFWTRRRVLSGQRFEAMTTCNGTSTSVGLPPVNCSVMACGMVHVNPLFAVREPRYESDWFGPNQSQHRSVHENETRLSPRAANCWVSDAVLPGCFGPFTNNSPASIHRSPWKAFWHWPVRPDWSEPRLESLVQRVGFVGLWLLSRGEVDGNISMKGSKGISRKTLA